MTRRRFTLWDLAFALILIVSIPAAIYHFSQGRYGNGLIAIGAFAVGVVVLALGIFRGQAPAPVVQARPRQPRPRRARRQPDRTPSGRVAAWLPLGVLSGFAATAVMTLILAVAYGVLAAAGSAEPGAGTFRNWMAALVDNTLVRSTGANLAAAVVLHFVAGIAWAILYAGVVEPRLSGSGWRRGTLFALLPWIFSLVVFLPAAGGGFLGLSLGAGPLPILGNLILHLAYGVTLGEVFMSEGLLTESGEVEEAAEPQLLARAERSMALLIVPGLVVGGLIGLVGSGIFAPGSDPLTVGVFGAVIGCVVGILLGSFVGVAASPEKH